MKNTAPQNFMPFSKSEFVSNQLCRIKKCVTSGTISFPLIDKSKYINTRSTDKYIVQHCNTERLKKSAIPNMQRLLNQLEKLHP